MELFKNYALKGHQARTKEEIKNLTHEKLELMSQDKELMCKIFFGQMSQNLCNKP
jgi:hypothetical protein